MRFRTTALPAPSGPVHRAGTIERNLITASGGTGILVLGDGATSSIVVDINDVEGAETAVLVDEGIVDAFLKSNILNGDGINNSGDIAICSDAGLNTIRANRINKFDDAIVEVGCTALASPAEATIVHTEKLEARVRC